MERPFDKMLVVANPAAQNGRGAQAADRVRSLLGAMLPPRCFEVVLTRAPGEAVELAASAPARGFDAVAALGGDGIVHEVANGLMRLGAGKRPALGLIPVGSGNDYARTLGMASDLDVAVAQLLEAPLRSIDVGRCNGTFFVETLSFGLDAAIALSSVELRRRTGRTGTALYLQAGLSQLAFHRDLCRYEAQLDGGAARRGESYLFAVQVGPTYGGGFSICPNADPADGLLDLCIAHPPFGLIGGALIFLRAKSGHHTASRKMEFHRVRSLSLRFDERPAVQADGEPLIADGYEIAAVPRALRVLMPAAGKGAAR